VASLPKPSQEIVDSLIGAIKSGAQVVRLDLDLRVCQEINSTSLGDFVLYWSWCITARYPAPVPFAGALLGRADAAPHSGSRE
jgi:hypothetical protein